MTVGNSFHDSDNVDKQQDKHKFIRKFKKKVCSVDTLKQRLPILQWLPRYNSTLLIQDIIAGITVGLTAIPQGIAYAVIAGLSPEYGLYTGLTGGFVYLVFGSVKDVTVGPAALLSAIIAKYVINYSPDFAVLITFLAGVIELTFGLLNLGFLIDFISIPVISGFTTAAALQIASGQLKSLFGLTGPSGSYFAESVYYFIKNVETAKLWDPILGFITIGILLLLQRLGKGCGRTGTLSQQLRWLMSLARNAIVIIIGIIIVYLLKILADKEPLEIIGDIGHGLPKIQPPPFSTTVGNETYSFMQMIEVYGPTTIILPFVAILQLVAISKAFAGGVPINATQELIALGLCNITASFVRSMPTTGSFTRTALNNKSGVQTQAGGIVTGILILLALSLLTSTFYYIPKASLAGLIINTMSSMIDISIFPRLWVTCKRELFVSVVTIVVCLLFALEYGIVAGILMDAAILLYETARPRVVINKISSIKGDYMIIPLSDNLSYCAAEHVREKVLRASQKTIDGSSIIIDATNLKYMDSTVASNLISLVKDLEKRSCSVLFLNFNPNIKNIFVAINDKYESKFSTTSNVMDFAEMLPKNV